LALLRHSYAEAGQAEPDVRVRRSFSGGARKATHCLQKNSWLEATTNGKPALPDRQARLPPKKVKLQNQ